MGCPGSGAKGVTRTCTPHMSKEHVERKIKQKTYGRMKTKEKTLFLRGNKLFGFVTHDMGNLMRTILHLVQATGDPEIEEAH